MTTTKNPIYTRRDSATAVLRKRGVDKGDYSKYVYAHPTETGSFVLDLMRLERETKPAKPARITKPRAPRSNEPKPAKQPKEPRVTVASACRNLIDQGLDNVQVWKALCNLYPNLTEKQKHYPAWYRAEMQRKKEGRNRVKVVE